MDNSSLLWKDHWITTDYFFFFKLNGIEKTTKLIIRYIFQDSVYIQK